MGVKVRELCRVGPPLWSLHGSQGWSSAQQPSVSVRRLHRLNHLPGQEFLLNADASENENQNYDLIFTFGIKSLKAGHEPLSKRNKNKQKAGQKAVFFTLLNYSSIHGCRTFR